MSKRVVKTARGYPKKINGTVRYFKEWSASGPGARRKVWNGTAYKTDGSPGLTKADLFMNKWGRIVSMKKHKTAKKDNRLKDYKTTKGAFGSVYVGNKTAKRSTKRRKSAKRRKSTKARRRR